MVGDVNLFFLEPSTAEVEIMIAGTWLFFFFEGGEGGVNFVVSAMCYPKICEFIKEKARLGWYLQLVAMVISKPLIMHVCCY